MKFTQNQQIVAEYYIASLGRSPDAEGLNYWTGKLDSNEMTTTQVRDMFLDRSIPEVAARFPEDQDSLTTVSNIYQNVFGRNGDEEGLLYWAARLDGNVDGFEPLNDNELISIMLDTAKSPQNYIDGNYLQVKLDDAEDYYEDLLENDLDNNISYTLSDGILTNEGDSDIILQDVGFNISEIFNLDGDIHTINLEGTIEQGYKGVVDGLTEAIPGVDFPDQVISENESFYLNGFLPANTYQDIPNMSGQIDMEVTLITTVGNFTDETTSYF